MRRIAFLAPALILTACEATPELGFQHVAMLPTATSGVVLRSDGRASVAMDDQVCVISTTTGEVLGDVDPAEGAEKLLDARGDRVLAAANGSIFTLSRTSPEDGVLASQRLDTLSARLTDTGAVALVRLNQGCALAWTHDDTFATAQTVTDISCDSAVLAVDPRTEVAWVADGQQLLRMAPNGDFERWSDVQADRVEVASAVSTVLLARTGESWLTAVTDTGEEAWTRSLSGPLVDIHTSSDGEVAAVSVEDPYGGGLLITEVSTGATLGEHPLPDAPTVRLSDTGDQLALVTPEEVHFYAVDTSVDPWESPAVVPGVKGGGLGKTVGAAAVVGTAVAVTLVLAD